MGELLERVGEPGEVEVVGLVEDPELAGAAHPELGDPVVVVHLPGHVGLEPSDRNGAADVATDHVVGLAHGRVGDHQLGGVVVQPVEVVPEGAGHGPLEGGGEHVGGVPEPFADPVAGHEITGPGDLPEPVDGDGGVDGVGGLAEPLGAGHAAGHVGRGALDPRGDVATDVAGAEAGHADEGFLTAVAERGGGTHGHRRLPPAHEL